MSPAFTRSPILCCAVKHPGHRRAHHTQRVLSAHRARRAGIRRSRTLIINAPQIVAALRFDHRVTIDARREARPQRHTIGASSSCVPVLYFAMIASITAIG